MKLVEDDVFQVLEEALGFAVCQKQGDLLRCRQQYIRRVQLLALTLGIRRVAGAVLDRDRQAHFGDGLRQVALDIDGQRLQRRDVERVDAGKGGTRRDLAAAREVGQRRQEPGERLAGAGRRNQQRALAGFGTGQQFKLVGARAPALFRKPAEKGCRQGKAGLGIDLIHGANVVQTRANRSGIDSPA